MLTNRMCLARMRVLVATVLGLLAVLSSNVESAHSQSNEIEALHREYMSLFDQGRYSEAEPLVQRELVLSERFFGR
jgi:hypothetical protein